MKLCSRGIVVATVGLLILSAAVGLAHSIPISSTDGSHLRHNERTVPASAGSSSGVPPSTYIFAVQDLIHRKLPAGVWNAFQLEIIDPVCRTPRAQLHATGLQSRERDGFVCAEEGQVPHDVYEVETKARPSGGSYGSDGSSGVDAVVVVLRGNNGVALASALNYYLNNACQSSISWGRRGSGDQLGPLQNRTTPLPTIPSVVRRVSRTPYRYSMNVCMFSYSAVWWTWADWESEIDWMALHGVNLPLAFTGQEAVAVRVFTALGLSPADIGSDFFTGPAFLAWNRMGNLQRWEGPLPDYWISGQMDLQVRIVARMRSFGMMTVLPAFAGHVPAALRTVFPHANVTESPLWAGFNATYSSTLLLDDSDPLYATIASSWLAQQEYLYGTDHFYNADTFNEMRPPSKDPAYLKSVSMKLYETLSTSDPDAVWVIQGWLFTFDPSFWGHDEIRAYLSGVPDDRMLILDLDAYAEPIWSTTDSFFGKPFIWCTLLNGGGRPGIYGNLTRAGLGPLEALAAPHSTMLGVGLSPEAINQNPAIFELTLDVVWWPEEASYSEKNISDWVSKFVSARYGPSSPESERAIEAAWQIAHETIYNSFPELFSVMTFRPSLDITPQRDINATAYVTVFRLMYSALLMDRTGNLVRSMPFTRDVKDFGRQMVANWFVDVFTDCISAYKARDKKSFLAASQTLRLIFDDLEALLSTDVNSLLGIWIDDAIGWSTLQSDIMLFNSNAQYQITLWGPRGEISDYASKMWAGLVGSYYSMRWGTFLDALELDLDDYRPFNVTDFNADCFSREVSWTTELSSYPTVPTTNLVDVLKTVSDRYTAAAPSYTFMNGMDLSGGDLFGPNNPAWSTDPAQLSRLCSLDSRCVGFNSNGYLKMDRSNPYKIEGVNLWMKNSASAVEQ